MNRSLQNFVQDVYGPPVWQDVVVQAGLEFNEFEAMLTYDDAVTAAVLNAVCQRLSKPRDVLLEDLGTYLVTHPTTWRIRRLLRFGGADLVDFIESLDDLADRARLAVPDLVMPRIHTSSDYGSIETGDAARFIVTCDSRFPGMEFVALGCIRAMADDYGALAIAQMIAPDDDTASAARIEVILLSTSFAEGNSFALAGRVS